MKLNKKQRELLKQKYGGYCAYCGTLLGDKWHADHLKPVMRLSEIVRVDKPNQTYIFKPTGVMLKPENDTEDNYMPACVACNLHKTNMSLECFRKCLQNHLVTLNKSVAHSIYRHAKRFGLVSETPKEIVFHFEKYLPPEELRGL
jgi:5-methylcytosine-specific restriction endonuclease McrA